MMPGELETYSLQDFMPMGSEVYFRLFVRQNEAVWPWQCIALLAGIAACCLVWRRTHAWQLRGAAVLMGVAWAWVGYSFHLQLHAELNWAATYMGWAFIGQGLLMAAWGLRTRFLNATRGPALKSGLGLFLIIFGIVIYPLLGPLFGRSWYGLELYGTAPDPTAIVTLGILLLPTRVPWLLVFIPALWCLYSGAAWWAMGWPAGLVTPAAVAVFILAILMPSGGARRSASA